MASLRRRILAAIRAFRRYPNGEYLRYQIEVAALEAEVRYLRELLRCR